MKSPTTMEALEKLGRVRLSPNFFMREFLYSEIANLHGMPNIPEDPDLALAAGTQFCEQLLEPLNAAFGRIHVRSAYRSPTVNAFGNANGFSCASNARSAANHIWDLRDSEGRMGATASIVIPWFSDRLEAGQSIDWREMAWWIHDHLPYHSMYFFPIRAAFNITWREQGEKRIDSYVAPKGTLTKPGMDNHGGSHAEHYADWPGLPLSR